MTSSIRMHMGPRSRTKAVASCLVAGALLIAVLAGPAALGDEPVPLRDRPAAISPLARDIDSQLARDVEHGLSLEQSRVGARSATPLQRHQTSRDVQVTRQNLNTLKTRVPNAAPIPLFERRLDRVSRPTGEVSRSPGLESGASTSLGLSTTIGGR
jgi:hypothetical protein